MHGQKKNRKQHTQLQADKQIGDTSNRSCNFAQAAAITGVKKKEKKNALKKKKKQSKNLPRRR